MYENRGGGLKMRYNIPFLTDQILEIINKCKLVYLCKLIEI